jgi:cell fate (sporulation/competence/biofilm development) regulator YlbF (YheA/YmcA/DUF963 family)
MTLRDEMPMTAKLADVGLAEVGLAEVGLAEVGLAEAFRAADAEALMAAGTFGGALRASPEFAALARADEQLAADIDAQATILAFQSRQRDLQMAIMFGTLEPSQRAELEELQATMLAARSVVAYLAAQEGLRSACRETAAIVSAEIGLDFAANCATGGCCG